jgi:ATP-dependent Lhr-like helicase
VFVNTRRLSERLAHMLAERLGEGQVAAHHGSLAKERRLRVETKLRAGELRALVATASLELGIDVGPVELVCQVGSPRSIATFLQRVGRSGHTRFGTPKGYLYPMTRDELCECLALLRAVRAGRLDRICFPSAPLDILGQQLVAECAAEPWKIDDLFDLVRRSAPYAQLSRERFDEVLELAVNGVETGRGRRAAYLHRDATLGQVRGRRGARLAALTSGGAIPEMADYKVIAEPSETLVGTINEDFAIESMAGDVFLLGSTSWRIRRVSGGVVRVVDAQGTAPTIPFWLGEAPARTLELSQELSTLRERVDREMGRGAEQGAVRFIEEQCGVTPEVACSAVDYLSTARNELGVLPTARGLLFERFFDDTGGMQLVLHSPLGARINRGLGLLLRKRFCRSFDFELQAAANDDAIVLSLGPQHSFPLHDIRDFLSPRGVREALKHAVLVTPMFGARWRWNLNRALIVLRYRGGKKNPPPLQRMEADDVMAAVFPALAACQDNATGPREIPDHPVVRQTLDDCFSEAMDVEGLETLLLDIERGAVQLHFRDTTEPSVLSHEILNGRPYTFLDDAPLEERRTQAVQLRRGLPLEARDLAHLDPEAVRRVRSEVEPQPRDAAELHDLLCTLGLMRPETRWQDHFELLCAAGRALTFAGNAGAVWCASEHKSSVARLFGHPRSEPASQVAPEPEAFARDVVRSHLEICGPSTIEALRHATMLSGELLQQALNVLEQEGFSMRGHFDPELSGEQFCARRLVGRIHAYTRARLRREIEPVTPRDYMRFLLDFQHVTSGTRLVGSSGLIKLVEQLQGFETAAGAWESEILPARLSSYRGEWLDAGCWAGEVVWGRLSLRNAPVDALSSVSRATPITLATRGDLGWLLSAVRVGATAQVPDTEATRLVIESLERRGASFLSELAQGTGLAPRELESALWDAVARGLISADGFAALRALMTSRRASASPRSIQRFGLRRGARSARARHGRWALLPEASDDHDPDELAEAVAEQLLARYGVVFRDVAVRESFGVPWRQIAWAFRRLEARGQIRGGRFVNGFVGEQYALPEAVDALRAVRRREPTGEVVRVSACDPLNLVGIVVPGARIPAQRGHHFCLLDGELALDPEQRVHVGAG